MAREMDEESARKQRELMVRVARSPEFSCCCIRLSREDRRRAKRVFRLSRRLTRDWEKERKERTKTEDVRT
ncbi:hypothetical protein [Hyphomicrobium sp.]|uniref:hypothetical protein n=1 Tax=Hyphomicrobium sp. TaxID=82 RepID=UPI0025C312C6|nr:hypothetical protein [Hyphomicrobium sp.]MCC7252317.1 hypothetical protein [Hyphomicrobium sp.]